MSICATIPVKVHCERCGWNESLDPGKHGPPVVILLFGDGVWTDLENRPKLCPSCGNSRLEVERAPSWKLISKSLNPVEK